MDKMEAEDEHPHKKTAKSRVRVAIRVRPMISRESAINQGSCVEYLPENKVIIGKDKCFSFDQVFNQRATQAQIYEKCVRDLVLACFEGYNAAILAYGQTGSGKTYTMGTGSTGVQTQSELGIIPRVIREIFTQVDNRKEANKIIVKVSFIQIYNQQIIDLLSPNGFLHSEPLKNKQSISKDMSNTPSIREEKDGSISLVNVVEEVVTDYEHMANLLHKGGNNRTTSSTLMNDCSSRSHGIFAIQIEQHGLAGLEEEGFITAKFYFVDLAGSERAKKTGASGMTFREGININLGLLELGNVISALSAAEKREGQFITYRNSKLTRILQDSLGGNSNTYMIACISPAQSNYEESLNTMKYATKAMNIKNTPVVNRDPHSAQINALKQKIQELENENKVLRRTLSESGLQIPIQKITRTDPRSDILSEEIKKLRKKIIEYDEKILRLEAELKQNTKKSNELEISNYELRRERDKYKLKLQKGKNTRNLRNIIEQQLQCEEQFSVVEQYQRKIRQLESQLFEQEKINNRMQQEYDKIGTEMHKDEELLLTKNKQILRLKAKIKSLLADNSKQVNEDELSRVCLSQPAEPVIRDIYEQNLMRPAQGNESEDCLSELENNEELVEIEAEFRENSNQHSKKLELMEQQIRLQEQRLNAMTEDQINLQYQLISQMKQEYHQKIALLQKQKASIIKQQEQMAGYERNPKLKQKIDALQFELRELRKKAKQQTNLQKQVALQNEQIKKLASEIKIHRVQKVEINRKIKEDRNAYEKFKKERMKEILMAKKQNIKKDKQIRKLSLENKRKSIMMSKKNEQLIKAKRIAEAVKSFSRHPKKNNSRHVFYSFHKKKNEDQNEKEQDSSFKQALNTIHSRSLQMVVYQEQLKIEMQVYNQKIIELEGQIERMIDEKASIQSKLDRATINEDYNTYELKRQPTLAEQELISKAEQIEERITLVEDNIIFCQQRYNELSVKLPQFHEEADVINNIALNTLPKMQYMLQLTYGALRKFIGQHLQVQKTLEAVSAQNIESKEQLQKMRDELSRTVFEHQQNLARLRQEMIARYYHSIEEQIYDQSVPNTTVKNSSSCNKLLEDRERKNYERKIFDLNKTNRQLSADVQMWRRKCAVVQDKYHNINMKVAKDKFIGRPRDEDPGNRKNASGWNIGSINSVNSSNTAAMLEQVNQIIEKMDRKRIAGSEDEQANPVNRNSEDIQFSKNKWQCVMTLKASRTPILSTAVHQKLLVVSGTKSITVWDQQSSQIVADMSNCNHLQGFVKYVHVVPQFSLLTAACDKQVFVWDIRTYNQVTVLRAHKDEVRCLYSYGGNVLITAGKGTSFNGGLLMWDLRMLDNPLPLEQKERNCDIFALNSHENTLYYGTRNHQVRRMALDSRQVMTPFEPPHMDTVTTLAVLDNKLLSGSKDKNLRLWGLDTAANNIKCTSHAFNDYVNVLEPDRLLSLFYAGSRDGQIKIGNISDDKIKFISGIMAHTQSVNSICSLSYRNPGMFLTGSGDKTVKFWRPDQATLDKLSGSSHEDY